MLQMRVDRKKHISPKEGWGQVGAPLAIYHGRQRAFEAVGVKADEFVPRYLHSWVQVGCAVVAHVCSPSPDG